MAVSPLFLYPYCGEGWTAAALICLAVSALLWMLLEPSRRSGESLLDARLRVFGGLVRDPVFWVLVVVVLLAGLRWANDGIGMVYNPEARSWTMGTPVLAFLPGAVKGHGTLEFAGALGSLAAVMSVRHALGKAARLSFLLTSSCLVALAAISWGLAAHCGVRGATDAVARGMLTSSFFGTAFALHLLGGIVALAGMFELGWNRMLLVYSFGLGGAMTGAYLLLPPHLVVFYATLATVTLVVSLVYVGVTRGASDTSKCVVAVLLSMLFPVLFSLALAPGVEATARMSALFSGDADAGLRFLLPERFWQSREVMSAMAFKDWLVHPWLGTGLGSFPIDMRFSAREADWLFLDVAQKLPSSGWWALLVERGIIGALMIALPVGGIAFTFVRRLLGAFRGKRLFIPGCWLGLACAVAFTVQSFVDASFLLPEAMMAAAAFLALAAASLPLQKRRKAKDDDKEGETTKG